MNSETETASTTKLAVNLGGLAMKNPVTVASGTFGYGGEYANYFDIARLGAVTTKSLSLKPRAGNRPPRLVETPAGMLNAIGLQNVGLDVYLSEKLPFLREHGATRSTERAWLRHRHRRAHARISSRNAGVDARIADGIGRQRQRIDRIGGPLRQSGIRRATRALAIRTV